ncbi:hypothetical protein JCM11251_002209 [Rhodosporidiobolus azoricus]
MMHPSPLFLLVFAAVVAGHSSALPPRHHRHLPLPLRLHQKGGQGHVVLSGLHKRDILEDLFCGIGLLSSCPEGTSPSKPPVDTDSDANNCGRLGNVCPSAFANGIGTGSCQLGTCITSCPTGFTYTANGCVDTRADLANCGAVGRACPANYENGQGSVCVQGECRPVSCDEGYTFEQGGTTCEPEEEEEPSETESPTSSTTSATPTSTTEPSPTAEPSATPTETSPSNGDDSSDSSSDSSGSSSDGVSPSLPSISARARARLLRQRSLSEPRTLCPSGLTACPISGSSSFRLAQSSLLAFAGPNSPLASGFECVDTAFEVESCGGCSTLGEGQNCLEIEGAKRVGCGEGRCVVFACSSGYKVDEAARKCVKVPGTKKAHHRNGTNHTRFHQH